tara:strand:- start:11125 stop:11445 length:321 start_codon:yes stop_codon:yes gene_type:complete
LDEKTCAKAAIGQHLDVLQFLHENRCPWEEHTTRNAAEGGHFLSLKWAHQNGCPWGKLQSAWCDGDGHIEMQRHYLEQLEKNAKLAAERNWVEQHVKDEAITLTGS